MHVDVLFFTIYFNQYIGATNSMIMFFVGVVVTLAIVLIVLFVIQIIYKRRRHASKLSTSGLAVDTVEMQDKTSSEAAQNNQVKFSAGRLLDHNYWLARKKNRIASALGLSTIYTR